MAFIQNNTPPPNKVFGFSLKDFSGGLNNRSNILSENEASSLVNMTFTDDSVMEKRRGSTNFDTLTLTGEIVFIDEYKPYNDDDVLIRATTTELYFGNTKVHDITGQISGANHNGRYFFADGSKIYVYGMFPQATTTYEEVLGTPVSVYTLMQVTNPSVGYTPLYNTHTKGKLVVDYVNMQIWYEPCENELADTFKEGNVLPEKPRYLISHNGRLFASGSDKDDDNVYITDLNNPFYFPSVLPLQLPPNSDKVVGLAVYDDAVIVGRRNDIFSITGATNRTNVGLDVYRINKVNSHMGFANHYAVNNANNYLFFLGSDGNAYALSDNRGGDKILNTTILTQTIYLFKDPINILKSDLATAHSIYYDEKWYLTIKDKILIYSYRHKAWTMYNKLNARSFYNFNDVLIWGDASGRISMPSTDFLDYGVPYRSYWTSKNFDMNDANSQKQFREFFLVAHTFEEVNSDIYVTFDVDYTDVRSAVTISNQLSVWGKAKFGDRFINRNINFSLPFMLGRRGRNLRFTFSNGYDVQGTVSLIADLEYFVGRKEGSLVKVTEDNNYYLFTNQIWVLADSAKLNQAMRVYEMNGEYELRGKR